jgi:hypothetical protein
MVASSVMSRAGIRGGQPTWGGDDRQPPVPSCSPRGEHGHQEQGDVRDQATVSGSQNRNGPLTGGPDLVKYIFKFPNSTQTCKFKKEALSCCKNIQTLHDSRFEYFEQLYQLGRLKILNRIHGINSGTE